jgi:HSP20 family protein
MPPERDLFANFERMRREMDELFGDVFQRSGIAPRERAGFSPAVDVSYADGPPRAIVTAELAGIDADRLQLEIQGRELVLSGERRAAEPEEGRVYQQVEIEHGPFRRVVQLSAEVRPEEATAVYEDGLLRVEVPLAQPESRRHSVTIEVSTTDPDPHERG